MRRASVLLLAAAACVGVPGDPIGQSSAALTPVIWTNVVNATPVANDLTCTLTSPSWNAGAVSVQTLAGDGYAEFTTAEISDKIAGLSAAVPANTPGSFANVEFGIRMYASGQAWVTESGVRLAALGSYSPGTRFRVQAAGGVVTYWKNNTLKFTSTQQPDFPLRVDVGFRTPGATINDVRMEMLDFWTDEVGVMVDGRSITKTAPEDEYNAGAVSLSAIESGDGFIEFRVADTITGKAVGLSNGNSGEGRNDIDYAF